MEAQSFRYLGPLGDPGGGGSVIGLGEQLCGCVNYPGPRIGLNFPMRASSFEPALFGPAHTTFEARP